MSIKNYPRSRYIPGAFKRECDASGFDFLSTELVRQWDGTYVHPRYLDPKPRDLTRKKIHTRPPLRIY